MRMAATATTLFVAMAFAPLAAGTTGGDCWTGGDAPTAHAIAPTIPLPSHCAGDFSASDAIDSYRFSASDGADLRIAIYGVFLLEICLELPGSDEVVDCYPIDDGEVLLEDVDGGSYALIIESEGSIGSYEFAVDTQTMAFHGKVLAGASATGIGLAESTGPASYFTGLDGAWIELPFAGTGNETIELTYSSPGAHGADLVLYDDAGNALPAGSCESSPDRIFLSTGAPQRACGLPSDAAWAFVRVDTGVALDYVIELHW